MKDKVLIIFAALLLYVSSPLCAQQTANEEVTTKLVSYIVIKGDRLKNVATRFQVSAAKLKKLNKLKSQNATVYPGLVLQIPVQVRPKIWDPSKEDISDNGLMSQDRRPSIDYEIIKDKFDLDIQDDFIAVSEAIDDSLQYENVGTHIAKIDKRIKLTSFRIDSAKQAEFAFQNSDTGVNSVLGRMKMARDKFYINGPLGRQIDSLNKVRYKLANLQMRLRNRLTEYEYLMDNVSYAKANYERDEKNKDKHWGDQISYETNLALSKARHGQLTDAMSLSHTDTAAIHSIAKDTMAVLTPIAKDTLPTTISPVIAAKDTTPLPPATKEPETVRTGLFGKRSKVDIAPLTVKNAPTEIKHTYKRELQLLPPAPVAVIVPVSRPVTDSIPAIVTKDTVIRKAVIAKADTTITTASAKSEQIVPIIQRHDTIIKPIAIKSDTSTVLRIPAVMPRIIIAKDTISKPSQNNATINASDTVNRPTKILVTKDTIAKPSQNTTAIKATDTTHKATTAIVVKDTIAVAKSAKSTTTSATNKSIDNTHKTIAAATPKDTIAKPAHTTVAIKRTDTTHKATVVAATVQTTSKPNTTTVKTNTPVVQKAKTVVKDTISKQTKNTAPAKKPDTAKATIAKAITPDTNESDVDEPTRIARDKAAKSKIPKKDTAPKTTSTATPDNTVIKTITAPPIDSSKIMREQVVLPHVKVDPHEMPVAQGPFLDLDLKYDSIMLYREKKINLDPLASYKTDSNFVSTTVQLKEIPILELKNKPKYLIPVDSISRIKAEFYLIRARQVLEKGDFKEGDKYLRKSLELNPNNAATWMLHADLCLTTGAADKALKEYDISGQIDSTNPKVFYNIALLYAKANDEQKAYKFFSRATDVNDKYLLAYMGRASVLMDTRDYEGAILDYDKTLSINKYYSPAYKGRALAKMEARKFSDAVVDFNQYLEIEDPDGYVLYERGIAKILSNNLLQGCLDLSSSLELGFKDAEKAIKKFCE